jgi:hypothetical protein
MEFKKITPIRVVTAKILVFLAVLCFGQLITALVYYGLEQVFWGNLFAALTFGVFAWISLKTRVQLRGRLQELWVIGMSASRIPGKMRFTDPEVEELKLVFGEDFLNNFKKES